MMNSGGIEMREDWMTAEHSMGTTIIAVEFEGGVVIGADSRTSTGDYVANRVSNKLTELSDLIYCCRSGSAADTQALADIVRYHLSVHALELGELPEVSAAASVFRDLIYNNKHLMAGIIVAGWDKYNGGCVYSLPLGGTCVRRPYAMGGSGSTYLYGYADAYFRPGMTEDECLKFVRSAVALAISRDAASGGIVRTAVITKDGVRRETIVPTLSI